MRILVVAVAFATCFFTTRADDLSDLVAFVASHDENISHVNSDVLTVGFDTLPHYVSKKTSQELDLLDGILESMTIRASLDYLIFALDSSDKKDFNAMPQFNRTPRYYSYSQYEFYRPVPGVITSRFGYRPQFGRMHHGVDLRLNIGDTVRAAMTGQVVRIAYDHDGYGNYVVIAHSNGMETIYAHLHHAIVGLGDYIEIGKPVGIGGDTGNSTGPHLHFETKVEGVAVDPTLIFDFNGHYRYVRNRGMQANLAEHQPSKSICGRRTYIVRQGDTAKSVAKRAGISVMRLCQLNMIQDNEPLQIGRMLKLK